MHSGVSNLSTLHNAIGPPSPAFEMNKTHLLCLQSLGSDAHLTWIILILSQDWWEILWQCGKCEKCSVGVARARNLYGCILWIFVLLNGHSKNLLKSATKYFICKYQDLLWSLPTSALKYSSSFVTVSIIIKTWVCFEPNPGGLMTIIFTSPSKECGYVHESLHDFKQAVCIKWLVYTFTYYAGDSQRFHWSKVRFVKGFVQEFVCNNIYDRISIFHMSYKNFW